MKRSKIEPREKRELGKFLIRNISARLLLMTVVLGFVIFFSSMLMIWHWSVDGIDDTVRVVVHQTELELTDKGDNAINDRNFRDQLSRLYEYTSNQNEEIINLYLLKGSDGVYQVLMMADVREEGIEFPENMIWTDPLGDIRYRKMNAFEDIDGLHSDVYVYRIKWGYLRFWSEVENPSGGDEYIVAVDCDVSDIVYTGLAIALSLTGAFVLTIILVFLRSSSILFLNVTVPLRELKKGVDSYKNGKLEINYSKFRWDDEIYQLARSFEDMTIKNEAYIKEIVQINSEKERVKHELVIAGEMQADVMPGDFVEFSKDKPFEIFAKVTPTQEVGGDFYDYFSIDDDRTGFVIADVSGKGVNAALFMFSSKTLIKEHLMMGKSPDETAETVNNRICENNPKEFFVTVWMGVYEASTGTLTYVNAGHLYPAVYRAEEGSYSFQIEDHDLVIGAVSDMKYTKHEMKLMPGDRLFLYTDGVTEAMNAGDEEFGDDRLIDTLNSDKEQNPADTAAHVERAVMEFCGGAPQHDDITMLCIRIGKG